MRKLSLLIAAGIGYVFGTKAGRERYDQIRDAALKVRNDPRVQEKTRQAADLAREQAPVVKDKVTEGAQAAATKVKGATGSSDPGDELNPDSTHFQKDPFPQGDLP
jgi:hypothetical protein